MLKRILQKALGYGHVALVLIVVASVPISGIYAAERQFTADQSRADKQSPEPADHAGLTRTAEDPEDAPDNMTPSGPVSEQPAYLKDAGLYKSTNSENPRLLGDAGQVRISPVGDAHAESRLATTAGAVNTLLGQRFTLVGSRPSGTS